LDNCIDLIGKRYKNGGRGPAEYDCWGVVLEVFKRNGITLKDYIIDATDTETIAETAKKDADEKNGIWRKISVPYGSGGPYLVTFELMEPGRVSHVGAYLDGYIIHALTKKNIVREPASKYQRLIGGYYEHR